MTSRQPRWDRGLGDRKDRSRSRSRDGPSLPAEEEEAARILASLKNDLEVQSAFEDGEDAAFSTQVGLGRRRRGGGRKGGREIAEAVAEGEEESNAARGATEQEVKEKVKTAAASGDTAAVAKVVAANRGVIGRIVDKAIVAGGKLRRGVEPAAVVVAVASAARTPSLFGNTARVAAAVFNNTLNAAVTSTWSDWLEASADVAGAIKSIATTIGLQTLQGPTVPFTVAMMIQAYRASSQGLGILQLTKADAKVMTDIVSRGIQAQKAAFDAAYAEEQRRITLAALKEISSRADRTEGVGAEKMSTELRSQGVPAYGSEGFRRGFAAPPPREAVSRLAAADPRAVAANTQARQDAQLLMGLSAVPVASDAMADASAASGANAAAAPDAPMNAGRRRRRTKRRAPKRKRMTRKALAFVY